LRRRGEKDQLLDGEGRKGRKGRTDEPAGEPCPELLRQALGDQHLNCRGRKKRAGKEDVHKGCTTLESGRGERRG